jgi:hypothetical protein
VEAHAGVLHAPLSSGVKVDKRMLLQADGLYGEPLERVLGYLGLSAASIMSLPVRVCMCACAVQLAGIYVLDEAVLRRDTLNCDPALEGYNERVFGN